jgi:hypothetical protein
MWQYCTYIRTSHCNFCLPGGMPVSSWILALITDTVSDNGSVNVSTCPFNLHSGFSLMLGTATLRDTGDWKEIKPEQIKHTLNRIYIFLICEHSYACTCSDVYTVQTVGLSSFLSYWLTNAHSTQFIKYYQICHLVWNQTPIKMMSFHLFYWTCQLHIFLHVITPFRMEFTLKSKIIIP